MSTLTSGARGAVLTDGARSLLPGLRFSTRLRTVLLSTVGITVVGLAWELSVRTGLLSSDVVPTLSATLVDTAQLLTLPGFWTTLGQTLTSAGLGLILAFAIAIPFGLALAESAWLRRLCTASIDAIRPIPPIVLLPIAILLLGGGLDFKLALILQGALWPLLIQTSYGIRSIDPVILDVSRSFRIDPLRRLFLLRIPAAAPVILSGLRLAASVAFGVSVMTELVGGERGLGSILSVAQSGNNVLRVYSITIVTGLVGLAIAAIFSRLHHWLLPWERVGR